MRHWGSKVYYKRIINEFCQRWQGWRVICQSTIPRWMIQVGALACPFISSIGDARVCRAHSPLFPRLHWAFNSTHSDTALANFACSIVLILSMIKIHQNMTWIIFCQSWNPQIALIQTSDSTRHVPLRHSCLYEATLVDALNRCRTWDIHLPFIICINKLKGHEELKTWKANERNSAFLQIMQKLIFSESSWNLKSLNSSDHGTCQDANQRWGWYLTALIALSIPLDTILAQQVSIFMNMILSRRCKSGPQINKQT